LFEHFSEQARRVITSAQDEAKKYGTQNIVPAHIMVSILVQGAPTTKIIMDQLVVDTEELEKEIRSTLVNEAKPVTGQILVSPIAKEVLKNAIRTAVTLNSKIVEVEHLIISILRNADEELVSILQKFGLNWKDIQRIVTSTPGDNKKDPEGVGVTSSGLTGTGLTQPREAKKEASILDHFGSNLTEMAKSGKLDPVIGRSSEVNRLVQVLARRTKNNPVLVGEPGVGKTAIVEGLAQALLKADAPKPLIGKEIYTLDLTAIVAGSRYRGDFEERMKKIMKEVTSRPDVILFIDEIHTMVGAGGAEGSMDASNIMKPALARGELQTIGATTLAEYRKYFEKDAALERRFQPIKVKEPSVEETVQILQGLRDRYEDFHKVTITDEAIEVAAQLSDRYIQDRFLPDKAIDLIDEAAARVRLSTGSAAPEVAEIDVKIEAAVKAKQEAISKQNYTKASKFSNEEALLLARREEVQKAWSDMEESMGSTVTDITIADILSESTGIPVYKITETESNRLLRMERELHKRVIGQKDAVKALSRTIRRQRTGLKDPKRPVGSFIFAGPTGVGKTELAKALAEFLFTDERSLITLDMSEYSEKHSVSRLFGPPPGYVGYEDGGQLTEAVRRNPFSVILLDEIEKAHPAAFDPLLQVLEEGRLTDGQGRVIDFKNTVIIMTTNLGASEIRNGSLGFRVGGDSSTRNEYDAMRNKVNSALKENLRPEFLNRIDDVIVFPHLEKPELLQIVNIFVGNLNERLVANGYSLEISEAARERLTEVGYDKTLGARPLRRAIQREIETPVSEAILFGKAAKNGVLKVDIKNGLFTFNGSTHEEFENELDDMELI
jgi:ATP-dependent Clp protease ATP-binding subunit ClpC